jgi:hypothetical protein
MPRKSDAERWREMAERARARADTRGETAGVVARFTAHSMEVPNERQG